MFDNNPKATPADVFVAGKTTEAVVRAIEASLRSRGTPIPIPVGPDATADPILVLGALVARFDRKAERKAAKAD